MEYVLLSSQQKSIVATGEAIVVMVDRDGKKMTLPDDMRQTIINLEQTVGNDLALDAQNPHKQPETLLGKALSRLSPLRDR